MDNFRIDVCGEGNEALEMALKIAFQENAPGGKAVHYRVVSLVDEVQYFGNSATNQKGFHENVSGLPGKHVHHFERCKEQEGGKLTLVLLWSDVKESTPLPFPLEIGDAIPFVKGWLKASGDPGPTPDIDGDVAEGWRVFTGAWGHVAGCSCAIVGVQAWWAMYGK